jgi:alpha-glucosidase
MDKSPLGITRKDQDFTRNLKFVRKGKVTAIDETYTMLIGRQTNLRNHANELTLTFSNDAGSLMELILRAYDDGVAFRYGFPGRSDDIYFVSEEATGFCPDTTGKAWMMPYSRPSQWGPAYESNYMNAISIGTASGSGNGWAFPLLFNTKGVWMLITEAGIDSTFYGAHIQQNIVNGLYRIQLPDPGEGQGRDIAEASSKLPWLTPWRIIMVGETPAKIIENNMVYHLSEPCKIKDVSWIKPGRVSWSWWSDHSSPRDVSKLKRFVDLSSNMTWEYSLVDANWNIMRNGNIEELIAYSKEKGVGLLLWYNSGGPHNTVTEQPRDKMNDRAIRRAEMKKLQDWGIRGIKVDFFHSDKPGMMKHYLNILEDAAEFHLLVDFHGCTLPRGWARTWPNLMSMEGVKGAEQYTGDRGFAENASIYNTIYAFTRNVVGSMDYTPVTFSDYSPETAHTTSLGHELALSVIFESGLQHFADRDSAYYSVPVYVRDFLKNIPVVWDETKYLSGEPGKFIALARRLGNTWYLAAIQGEKQSRKLTLPLSFLGNGSYKIELITDNETGTGFGIIPREVTSDSSLELELRSKGGFAGTITKIHDVIE